MKAIEIAEKIQTSIDKINIITYACPYNFHTMERFDCVKSDHTFDECEKCWNQEVDIEKSEWLVEVAEIFKIMNRGF